jgi:hypothetical protein
MRGYHWGMIFVVLFAGYLAGVWFPGPGQSLKAKLGM